MCSRQKNTREGHMTDPPQSAVRFSVINRLTTLKWMHVEANQQTQYFGAHVGTLLSRGAGLRLWEPPNQPFRLWFVHIFSSRGLKGSRSYMEGRWPPFRTFWILSTSQVLLSHNCTVLHTSDKLFARHYRLDIVHSEYFILERTCTCT